MYGKHMNDLTEICTQVWATQDLEAKKNLLIRAVNTFKYKAKIDSFTKTIKSLKDPSACDKLASNIILNKTDKVVDMLPR